MGRRERLWRPRPPGGFGLFRGAVRWWRPSPERAWRGRTPARIADDRVPVAFRRYPGVVKHSVLSTTPTAEKPALSDEQRAKRLRLLAERVLRPDGLDRDTLEHIEQLTDAER